MTSEELEDKIEWIATCRREIAGVMTEIHDNIVVSCSDIPVAIYERYIDAIIDAMKKEHEILGLMMDAYHEKYYPKEDEDEKT